MSEAVPEIAVTLQRIATTLEGIHEEMIHINERAADSSTQHTLHRRREGHDTA